MELNFGKLVFSLLIVGAHVFSQELLEEDDLEINVFEVEDACPSWSNGTQSSCPVHEKQFSPCAEDHQCKIGSRCCQIVGCLLPHCVDTTEGTISEPKPIGLAKPVRRSTRRVVRRCTACSCQRLCRSDNDCRRGSRRKCYRNTCSSYCIKG